MEARRAMASLALDILHMGCRFYTLKATFLTVSRRVTAKTFRIMIFTAHFQYPEIFCILPIGVSFYMLRMARLTFIHSYIHGFFLLLFSQGSENLKWDRHTEAHNSSEQNSLSDKTIHHLPLFC